MTVAEKVIERAVRTLPQHDTAPLNQRPDAEAGRAGATGRRWEGRYVRLLLVADLIAAALATGLTLVLPLGSVPGTGGARQLALSLLPFCWLAVLTVARAYETRMLFVGGEEYQRILRAGVEFTVLVALASYVLGGPVPRNHLVVALALTTGLSLAGRVAMRRGLHRVRVQGRCVRRVVAIGHPAALTNLIGQLHRHYYHGLRVVGTCLPDAGTHGPDEIAGVPVLGTAQQIAGAVRAVDADTVIVLPSPELDGPALRRLGWQLEGDDVDLITASSLLDVTGNRITIRPIDGLPLMHIEHPRLSGGRHLVKSVLGVTVAAGLLLALAPVLLVIAALIKLDSPGPVFFRQIRVGRHGEQFAMFKFRTMAIDAEQRLADLREHNEHDGVLFKIRHDPRVTRVGRHLRRYSLDELPQLLNVLLGQMALVGPRPPLQSEVDRYPADARRRLVVKPGMTGLWQVSGRSDLPWDEAVRLDLRYVENWSLTLDLVILLRTASAVLRGSGAY